MPTEPDSEHIKSANIVKSAIEKFRPKAVEKLGHLPVAEGVTPIDYGAVLDDLHGRLTWIQDDLLSNGSAYSVELANDRKRILQRDDDAKALTQKMVQVRGMFQNCYQPVRIEEFGFPRNVHRDPEKLYLQGKELILRLREPELPLPDPPSEETAQDPAHLADLVEKCLKPLDDSLLHVRGERRGAQVAKTEHDESVARFKRIFDGSAFMARGIFLLADEKELADRVKPSSTKSGVTERDPDDLLEEDDQETGDPFEGAEDPAETDSEFPDDDSESTELEEP